MSGGQNIDVPVAVAHAGAVPSIVKMPNRRTSRWHFFEPSVQNFSVGEQPPHFAKLYWYRFGVVALGVNANVPL